MRLRIKQPILTQKKIEWSIIALARQSMTHLNLIDRNLDAPHFMNAHVNAKPSGRTMAKRVPPHLGQGVSTLPEAARAPTHIPFLRKYRETVRKKKNQSQTKVEKTGETNGNRTEDEWYELWYFWSKYMNVLNARQNNTIKMNTGIDG